MNDQSNKAEAANFLQAAKADTDNSLDCVPLGESFIIQDNINIVNNPVANKDEEAPKDQNQED